MKARSVVLVVGVLALVGCGGGGAGAFCADAAELKATIDEVLALVVEEDDPSLEQVRDAGERAARLSRRLAEAAPDDGVRRDYELIAEYQDRASERLASLTSPDQAMPMPADEAIGQAFDRTEAYVLEECGIDLWPQV